jgi:hypothetical protein
MLQKIFQEKHQVQAQNTDVLAQYFQGRVDKLTGRLVVDAHDLGDLLVAEMVPEAQVDGLLLPGAELLVAGVELPEQLLLPFGVDPLRFDQLLVAFQMVHLRHVGGFVEDVLLLGSLDFVAQRPEQVKPNGIRFAQILAALPQVDEQVVQAVFYELHVAGDTVPVADQLAGVQLVNALKRRPVAPSEGIPQVYVLRSV